jgi:hypothetical protein
LQLSVNHQVLQVEEQNKSQNKPAYQAITLSGTYRGINAHIKSHEVISSGDKCTYVLTFIVLSMDPE